MQQIKATILFIVLFFGIKHNVLSQCVDGNFDVPDCIQVGVPVTFTNTSIDNNTGGNWYCNSTEYYWDIRDSTGNSIYLSAGTPSFNLTNFSFPYAGSFAVEIFPYIPLGPYQTNQCCPGGYGNIWTDPWQQNIICC